MPKRVRQLAERVVILAMVVMRGAGCAEGLLALTEFLTLMKLSTSMTLPCRLLPTRLGCWGCC